MNLCFSKVPEYKKLPSTGTIKVHVGKQAKKDHQESNSLDLKNATSLSLQNSPHLSKVHVRANCMLYVVDKNNKKTEIVKI